MEILTLNNKEIISRLPKIVNDKLGTKIDKIKFIGGGSYGKVFKAESIDWGLIVLKAYRKKGMEIQEANQLKNLAENTSVSMPKVYFTYSDDTIAVMAMSYIEGRNVLDPAFIFKSKSSKKAFARDVVSGMLEWHNVTNDKFGLLDNPTHSGWLEFYRDTMVIPRLDGLKELCDKGKFSKNNFDLLCDSTEIFFDIAHEPENAVLIHGDLNIMNIMADPKTFRLTGFIDPCGTMWADREYDLYQLHSMWGDCFGLYEEYKSRYELSENCDFKVAYYGALHEASMRLNGGLTVPVWEMMCNARLKKELSKIKR